MLWHKVSPGVKLWQIFSNFDLGRVIGASSAGLVWARQVTVILHNLIVRGGPETWQPDFAVIYCLARSVGLEFRTHLAPRKYIRVCFIGLVCRPEKFVVSLKVTFTTFSYIPMANCSVFLQIKSQDKDEVCELDFSLFCPRSEPLVSHYAHFIAEGN